MASGLLIVTSTKFGLFENASIPTLVTVEGKIIDVKSLYSKASAPIVVTEAGIVTEVSALYLNALAPMLVITGQRQKSRLLTLFLLRLSSLMQGLFLQML